MIFGNGQALDLGYANNPAHTAEVMQDVVSGGEHLCHNICRAGDQ